MINLDVLNAFSRRFADRLLAEHPEWLTYATIPSGEGWDDGVLAVSITSPISSHTLSIDTNGGEVTVGFGGTGWHAHFWAWDGLDEATVFDRALKEIADILSEEVAILTRMRGSEIGSSETFWRGEQIKFNGAERVEIISWLGNRDATEFPA